MGIASNFSINEYNLGFKNYASSYVTATQSDISRDLTSHTLIGRT
jgi:hypothetical protein